MGLVRPSTKSFSDSDEIWYIGKRSMSDARRYAVWPDPRSMAKRPLKLEILRFSKSISSHIFNVSWQMTTDSETTEQYITFVFVRSRFLISVLVFVSRDFKLKSLQMLLLLQYHSPDGGGILRSWPLTPYGANFNRPNWFSYTMNTVWENLLRLRLKLRFLSRDLDLDIDLQKSSRSSIGDGNSVLNQLQRYCNTTQLQHKIHCCKTL